MRTIEIKINKEELKRKLGLRNGEDGISPDKDKIIREVVALIPTPKNGNDGKDFDMTLWEDFKEKIDKEIVVKINILTEAIEMNIIKGLQKELNVMKQNMRQGMRIGGGSSTILTYDLTPDGSTKVFTIPSNRRVLGVFGSDFPQATLGFTGSGTTTLTLTAANAPSAGSELWILYVKK